MSILDNMTQERWNLLSIDERQRMQDLSGLSPQLVGLEGWRIAVIDGNGESRRFIVGRSTGWRPCHIELRTRRSAGGIGADREYRRVVKLYRVR